VRKEAVDESWLGDMIPELIVLCRVDVDGGEGCIAATDMVEVILLFVCACCFSKPSSSPQPCLNPSVEALVEARPSSSGQMSPQTRTERSAELISLRLTLIIFTRTISDTA
jgi:hypothetical protein